MKKEITINQFVDELIERLNNNKTIDCCKEEIINFGKMAKDVMGDKMIEVNWKE